MDQNEGSPPVVRPLDRGGAPLPQAAPAPRAAPARPAKARAARRLHLPRRALIAAAVVVVAAVVLWFFFIRDPGNPFRGTWTATNAPVNAVVISGPGRHIEATFSGNDTAGTVQTFTVAAHKDGSDLVVTAEDFAAAAGDAATATQVRDTFAAIVKDFRLVFSREDETHLRLTVQGTFIGVINVSLAQRSIVLTKVD